MDLGRVSVQLIGLFRFHNEVRYEVSAHFPKHVFNPSYNELPFLYVSRSEERISVDDLGRSGNISDTPIRVAKIQKSDIDIQKYSIALKH